MTRYVATLVVALLFVSIALLVLRYHGSDLNEAIVTAMTTMFVLGVVWSILCVWGFLGIAIARRQEELRDGSAAPATILRRSLHYRFNKWSYTRGSGCGLEWYPPTSRCQYWAETLHNLIVVTPTVTLLARIIFGAVLLVGWLAGFHTNFRSFDDMNASGSDMFPEESGRMRRQWGGPSIGAGILVAVGIVTGIRTGFYAMLFEFLGGGQLWALLAGLAGVLPYVLVAVVIGYILIRVVLASRAPASYVLDRLAGICRMIRYTDE